MVGDWGVRNWDWGRDIVIRIRGVDGWGSREDEIIGMRVKNWEVRVLCGIIIKYYWRGSELDD